jgi:hypothetical protein
VSDPDLEELLKLAESAQNPEEKDLNEAERWVVAAGIKAGSERISNALLYYTYCEWAERPIVKYQFTRQFKKLFKQHLDGERFYLLDPAPFDLSRDTYFKIRRNMRDARKRNARKENKTKPD